MVKFIDDNVRRYHEGIAWLREHSGAFDHLWRAKGRYGEMMGGRLAAAMSYYGFFAAFALALVAYSLLGFALGSFPDLKESVDEFLANNVPWLQSSEIEQSRGAAGLIGLIGLVLTGVGWVESMRSAQRAVWGLDQQPGNLIVRRLVDLGMLVALGLLVALSLWATSGIEALLFALTPGYLTPWMQDALGATSTVLGVLLNVLLAAALLAGVPRLRVPPRRLLPPAVLVGLGLTLLTTVGQALVRRTEQNPAYQIAGGVVGLLVFLYLFNQLLLIGAAVAATSRRGKVMDLAAGPPAPIATQDGHKSIVALHLRARAGANRQ